MTDDVLAIIETPGGEHYCPHCEHFLDWHRGLPFDGGTGGKWRYRCSCGCTVDVLLGGTLRALDRDTYEPRTCEPSPEAERRPLGRGVPTCSMCGHSATQHVDGVARQELNSIGCTTCSQCEVQRMSLEGGD